MTTKQAAEILGVKMTTVNTLIQRKQIAATKFGRDWLITPEEVERYQRERHKPGWPHWKWRQQGRE